MNGPRKQIDFLFFDAGGGHRAAATALREVIEEEGRPWDIRVVNLQEVMDQVDLIRKVTGIRAQDVYNLLLKKGWTLGSPQMLVGLHFMIRACHAPMARVLRAFWAQSKPDLVVSLIPNFGRTVYESLGAVHPETPLVTILTDMADYPPHFWMEPGQRQYWICGTEKAVDQARSLGYESDRVFGVSGMIVNPRFYKPLTVDRAAERTRLQLEAQRPTGILMFGGQGSSAMRAILERVAEKNGGAQYIAICGKNDRLRRELAGTRWPMPVHVEGFTKEIPYFMALSDFLIGKPGPGTISEAMHMGLPAIVEKNSWTLPQERYNAVWLEEKGTGIVLRNFRDIASAVGSLISGDALGRFRSNIDKLDNRAVFEIPPILDHILAAGR